ncbi:MAG: hypothetical protein NTV29_19075 [Planctomycetota bacterium]|nr:hypothetical protein [Planctomycetota bacterium]
MSEVSDDPFELVEAPANDPQQSPQRMKRLRVLWGILVLIATLVGDFGVPSLHLGPDWLGCVSIGLWLAQYIALWLLIHSYVASKLTRVLLGLILPLCISLFVIVGTGIAWPPGIPIRFVAIIMVGSLGIYSLAGWLLSRMLRRSDFYWISKTTVNSGQYSIRLMLGAMIVSAMVAMAAKWLRFRPVGSGISYSFMDFLAIGIWFMWLAIGIMLLAFFQIGAVRSRSRLYYRRLFTFVLLAGPLVFQTVGLMLISIGAAFSMHHRLEFYLMAYAIEAGIVVGIASVIPLLPSRHDSELAD